MLGPENFHDGGDGATLAAVEEDGPQDALFGLDILGRKMPLAFSVFLGIVRSFHRQTQRAERPESTSGVR